MSFVHIDYSPEADPDSVFGSTIYEVAKAQPNADPRGLAESYVASLSVDRLREFATLYIARQFEQWQRFHARESEVNHERDSRCATDAQLVRNYDNDHVLRLFTAYRDDPLHVGILRSWNRAFKQWMGDKFDEWHDARAQFLFANHNAPYLDDDGEESVSRYHEFMADWNPAGPTAYYGELQIQQINRMIRRYARTIRMEITERLLATKFALLDGTWVTWGDATIEHHESRIRFFAMSAKANVRAASRHASAVSMLNESGAVCLREIAQTK